MARATSNHAARANAPQRAQPFLKWAGGKRRLLPDIMAFVPASFSRYREPFIGGAALFFELRAGGLKPGKCTLADTNLRLIRTYRGLQHCVEDVIALLKTYPHDKKFYLDLRQSPIDDASDAEVAAWFIYLNRTGYNGLYRVNRKNGFNVPFGNYPKPRICDEDGLRRCAQALQKVRLEHGDFAKVAERSKAEDLVYFDPPYVPLSGTANFRNYTKAGFSEDDQTRLRDLALRLKRRGVHVLLSNSATPLVEELYGQDFELIPIMASRNINCHSDKRGKVKEYVIK